MCRGCVAAHGLRRRRYKYGGAGGPVTNAGLFPM